jgi:hypothetical protein
MYLNFLFFFLLKLLATILYLISLIGKSDYKAIVPFVSTPEMRDALFSQYCSFTVCNMLKDIAEKDAISLVDWVDDLKEVLKGDSMKMYSIASIFGYIGR